MITCLKRYSQIPFAHRQPLHDGHCAQVHGHNWDFEFQFAAKHLDENGFVVDFGKLAFIKEKLNALFDHRFVVPRNDREMATWLDLERKGLMKVTIVEDASCEGLARWLLDHIGEMVKEETDGRVSVISVAVFEDSKNSALALR